MEPKHHDFLNLIQKVHRCQNFHKSNLNFYLYLLYIKWFIKTTKILILCPLNNYIFSLQKFFTYHYVVAASHKTRQLMKIITIHHQRLTVQVRHKTRRQILKENRNLNSEAFFYFILFFFGWETLKPSMFKIDNFKF